MKTKIIQALLHTLLESYGNESIYHPDGTAYKVEDLKFRFGPTVSVELPEGTEPPTGAAAEIEHYESVADSVVHELLGQLSPHDDLFAEYYEFRNLVQVRARENFPTTKFGNF